MWAGLIERTEYQDVRDENRKRVTANRDYYKYDSKSSSISSEY
jgi:hypothetical protein